MAFTEIATAAAMTLQLFCVPPKKAPDLEIQKLEITVREKKRLDIEVEYLTHGTLYGVKDYQEFIDEAINLPTPHGMKGSTYQIRSELDDWYLYQYTVDGNVIVKSIKCEYREVSALE
ncbi:MAG: hypothetical protein V4596_02830 [Bdellovibrionota bacterium]